MLLTAGQVIEPNDLNDRRRIKKKAHARFLSPLHAIHQRSGAGYVLISVGTWRGNCSAMRKLPCVFKGFGL